MQRGPALFHKQSHRFQPIVNYRMLEFDKALSARHICQIVNRWADFAGLNQNPDKGDLDHSGTRKKPKPRLRLSPHDLRRTAITRALSLGFTPWRNTG